MTSALEAPPPVPSRPLPPAAALRITAAEMPTGRTARAVRAAADRVCAGEDPREALGAVRADLPPALAGLLELPVGERLPGVLTAAARAAADRNEERRRLARALLWPLALFGATALVAGGALALLAPIFRELFDDFGTPLPGITKVVLSLGEWLRAGWFVAAPLGVAAIAVPLAVLNRAASTRWPLVGVLRPGEQARACELLAELIDVRVPLPEALRAVGWTTPDARLGADLAEVAEATTRGTPAAAATFGHKWLPPPMRAALRWADDPGALSEGLRGAAETLRARVDRRIGPHGVLAVVVPLVLVLVVATGVFFMTLALLAPLIDLLNDLA